MNVKSVLGAILLLASPTAPAISPGICALDLTPDRCADAVTAWVAAQNGEIVAAGKEILAARNTGDGSVALSGSGGSINDFLPLLRAIIDTGPLSGEGGQRLGFEWSNPLGLPSAHQNKLTVAAGKSELFEPLEDALDAASLQDTVSELRDGLNEGDDVEVGFSYSPLSAAMGRDVESHTDVLSSLLEHASQLESPAESTRDEAQERVDVLEKKANALGFTGRFADFPGDQAKKEEYAAAVEAAHLATHAALSDLRDRLTQVGFYRTLDLINNQPQLSVTASYRARDELVGPDEFRAVVSYELGWNNVNTFRDFRDRSCKATATTAALSQTACFARFLPTVQDNLNGSPRITFHAEYVKRNRLDVTLPTSAFTFAMEPQESMKISAVYGRYLGKQAGDLTRPRLDAALSYEDLSDDPLRQSRGLATATLTYPVGNGLYLSLGAVYATKPEFRGDVDEELSARAGVTYKVIQEEN